jgi:PBP1b-binding outer membrane lipoprotein LpoB
MKKSLLILPLVLSGCVFTSTTNVMPKWPDVPAEVMQSCPDLETIDKTQVEFSDVLDVVTDNYAKYKECQIKVDAWIQWYNVQKKIYETVK